jgi:uncharacterized membrane protein
MTSRSKLPDFVFVFLVFLGLLQAKSFAARMPAVMATHFASSGTANGWQSRSAFFVTEMVLLGVCVLVAFGVPRLIGALPVSLLNVPNKEYWMAPERREQTVAFFKVQFGWFGCAFLAFLLVVNELVFAANQSHPRHLNNTAFATALVAFLAFVAVWTGRLIFYFSKAKAD